MSLTAERKFSEEVWLSTVLSWWRLHSHMYVILYYDAIYNALITFVCHLYSCQNSKLFSSSHETWSEE